MSVNASDADSAARPVPPGLLARVRHYALIVGGLCALVGALEGAVVGAMVAPHGNAGRLVLAVACDRCLLLGLAGAVFGAAIAVGERYLGLGKKRAS